MTSRVFRLAALAPVVAMLALSVTGCKDLPGSREAQGAAIGGLGGAAAGAAVAGKGNRVVGAILGGALGAAGGYVVGANTGKISDGDREGANKAAAKAQTNPATPSEALNASTADVNQDGFVTMDEVVAMEKAGLTNQEMLDRLRATGQVFELTAEQRDYLRNNGVDQKIIDEMEDLNQDARNRVLTSTDRKDRDLNEPVPAPPSDGR